MKQPLNLPAEDKSEVEKIFSSIRPNKKGEISISKLWNSLAKTGIQKDDIRLKALNDYFENLQTGFDDEHSMIKFDQFLDIIQQNRIVKEALQARLTIPAFEDFKKNLTEIFDKTKTINEGKVATYIPQLAKVDPEKYAISFCSIDGQRYNIGDYKDKFSIQSTSKTVNYCIALEEHGEEKVHNHVGREPSGQKFNEITLNENGLPHNPLINAGAIMCSSLIKLNKKPAEAFDKVIDTWQLCCGGKRPGFNNSIYQSERNTADRNFALAYFMKENKGFPEGTNLNETLELYFQCCSIELDTEMLSIAAATLANSGVCPFTGSRVFSSKTVQNCLSLMSSCGMYDYSGEFAFTIGLPAKSGVSGALTLVIPDLGGIAIWGPKLDKIGNSIKGIEFCKELLKKYNFHKYDILFDKSDKTDPTKKKYENRSQAIISLIYAATYGDLDEITMLEANGVDLNAADYDGRTALHLASAEGREEVVEYLLNKGVDPNSIDRWGATPLKDAERAKNQKIIELLSRK